MIECKICKKCFETKQQLGGHIRCSHREQKLLNRIVVKKVCLKCGNIFEIERILNKDNTERISKKEKNFCCVKCANSRNIDKHKISEGMKKSNNIYRIEKCYCTDCGKEIKKNKTGYCQKCLITHKTISKETREKLSNAGKKSSQIQKETRRSKNEKLFFELCERNFSNVKHNESIFNGWDADIILEDLKIAVLWNGKWHYESIGGHSVKQVQNRDKIKIKEIEKIGWIAYIIKDMGKYNPLFVQEEFDRFLQYIAG